MTDWLDYFSTASARETTMQLSTKPAQWVCQIETVTPERAAALLKTYNTKNRRLRPGAVTKCARLMTDGDWKLSPEAIVISETNRMLNGQHRLHALIKAGVTLQFLFIYGPPDNIFQVLDRGARRSTADAMEMDRRLVEVGALICSTQGGAHESVNDFRIATAAACVAEEHRALLKQCNTARAVCSTAGFRLAAVARVMSGADRDYIYGLYRSLVLGHTEDLPPVGHAAMRMFLQGGFAAHGNGTAGRVKTLCTAWAIFDPAKRNNKRFLSAPRERCVAEIVAAIGYQP